MFPNTFSSLDIKSQRVLTPRTLCSHRAWWECQRYQKSFIFHVRQRLSAGSSRMAVGGVSWPMWVSMWWLMKATSIGKWSALENIRELTHVNTIRSLAQWRKEQEGFLIIKDVTYLTTWENITNHMSIFPLDVFEPAWCTSWKQRNFHEVDQSSKMSQTSLQHEHCTCSSALWLEEVKLFNSHIWLSIEIQLKSQRKHETNDYAPMYFFSISFHLNCFSHL